MKHFVLVLLVGLFSLSVYGQADTVLTQDLDGTSITYVYSGGRSYQVSLNESTISYRYLTGSKPEAWWGPFPYKATLTDKGEYLLAWFEESYGDYVTLLVDLEAGTLFGSGILGGKSTHFERAEIIEIKR